MERFAWPVHWIRLLVALALMGALFGIATALSKGTTLLGMVFLFSVPIYAWLMIQGAEKGALDGLATGAIVGLGGGAAMGWGAYQASDWFVVQTSREPGAFWGWFLALFVVNVLLGSALGSIHARKDIDPTTGLPYEEEEPSEITMESV